MNTFVVIQTNSPEHADELIEVLIEFLSEQRVTKGKKSPNEVLIRTQHTYLKKIEKEITKFNRRKHPKVPTPPDLEALEKVLKE